MDGKEEDCTEAKAPEEDVPGGDAANGDEAATEVPQDPLVSEAAYVPTVEDQEPPSEPLLENVDPLKELEDSTSEPNLSIEPEAEKLSDPSEEIKEKPVEGMEPEKAISTEVEPMELEESEEKVAEQQQLDTVCQLEEELKRLHGGEPEEEPKLEKAENVEGALKSLLEDEDDVKQEVKIEKAKENEKPIMKDSDLEEMLSADDVVKDPGLIKASQEDLKTTDVLVCGRCHEVFHFIEEFRSHKSQVCKAKSAIVPVCEGELKPQIWGFTLWKNKLISSLKPNEAVPTSWVTYQKWCKLPLIDKNTWISAGQTLQYCNRVGAMKIIDESNKENSVDNSLMKVTRSVIVHDKPTDPNANTALRTHSMESKEFAVERIVAKRFNPKKKYWEYQIKWEHFSNEENTWEPVTNLTHCKQMVEEFEAHLKRLKTEKAKQQQQAIATSTPILKKKVSVPSSSAIDYTPGRPQRTSKQKALNQVKAWCGNISDDDTPSSLKRKLDNDSDDSFEKKLKLEDYSDDSDDQKPVSVSRAPPYRKIAPKPSSGQLVRNGIDKMSPLPQNVLIPDANGVVRINQKQLPSLSTGVYIMSKTAGIIKLDSATSKVATSGGQTIVKVAPKIGQTQIKIVKKDGTSTTTTKQLLPANNKQMGMTTTKVYKPIITKVKKPSEIDTQKKSEMMKKLNDIAKRNPELGQKPMKVSGDSSKKDSLSIMDFSDVEDNDDGIEDVPFPEEIKVPEPESPHDFTLDPFTGKLAGVEYPEVPEQDPAPDPEPTEEAKSDSSLDNIVKLAAADITEEDLKNEPVDVNLASLQSQQEDDEDDGEKQSGEKKQMVIKGEPSTQPQTKTIIRMPMGISQYKSKAPAASPSSILNKVLTGTPIIRRQPAPPPVPRMQQKLLSQSVSRAPLNSVVRVGNTTYVRKSIPKSRYIPGAKLIKAQHDSSTGKSVYTYSRPVMHTVTRKIGDTTIKSTTSAAASTAAAPGTPSRNTLIAQRPVPSGAIGTPRPQTRVVQTGSSGLQQKMIPSPRREMPIIRHQLVEKKMSMGMKMSHRPQAMVGGQQKQKQVISMPSLLDDDPETESNIQLAKVTTPPPEMSPTTSAIMEHAQPLGEVPSVETQAATESTEEGIEGQSAAPVTDLSSFTLADNDNPIFITGDDGTVYQVAGQNEQGQTILLTQGSDGQQQCLLVTSETAESMEHVNAEEQQQAQQEIQQQGDDIVMPEIGAASVTEPLSVKTDQDTNDQVVAQVVRAEPPSPGGTHKVVVMLPDGNLMVTQVSPEEYASLELE